MTLEELSDLFKIKHS